MAHFSGLLCPSKSHIKSVPQKNHEINAGIKKLRKVSEGANKGTNALLAEIELAANERAGKGTSPLLAEIKIAANKINNQSE